MTCFRMPNGETVHNYCKRTGLCYDSVYFRLDAGKELDVAIAETKECRGRKGGKPKYMLNGISLRQWCIKHNICYITIFIKATKKGINPVDYVKQNYFSPTA